MNGLSVGLALFGGFLFGIGAVLQQKGTLEEPNTSALSGERNDTDATAPVSSCSTTSPRSRPRTM